MCESDSIWWTKPATAQSEEYQRQEEKGLHFLLCPFRTKKKTKQKHAAFPWFCLSGSSQDKKLLLYLRNNVKAADSQLPEFVCS